MTTDRPQMTRKTACNSTFAIGGVSCSADSFVGKESAVLRINFCAEKPAHRKSAKRYVQLFGDLLTLNFVALIEQFLDNTDNNRHRFERTGNA